MSQILLTLMTLMTFCFTHAQTISGDCPPLPVNSVLKKGKLSENKDCFLTSTSLTIPESIYLNMALTLRADDLACAQNGINALMSVGKSGKKNQAESIILDTEAKAKLITGFKKEIVKLVADRGRLSPSLQKEKVIENDQKQNSLQQAIELTYQSMYLGSTTQMRDFADSLTNRERTPEQSLVIFGDTLSKISEEVSAQEKEVRLLSKSDSKKDLSNELRRSLTKDTDIFQKIIKNNKTDSKFFQIIQCQLDEKFGYRKESREQTIDLALNAGAILIPVGTGFTLLKFAASRAATAAKVARGAKYSSFAAGAVAGGLSATESISRACSDSSRDVKISTRSSCSGSEKELQNYLVDNLKKQNCTHEFMLQLLYLTPAAAVEVNQFLKSRPEVKYYAGDMRIKISNPIFYSGSEIEILNIYVKQNASALERLQKSFDPHALYLGEIGIRTNSIISPDKVFRKIDDKISDLVKSGALKESETLRPGRVMQLRSGEIKVFAADEAIPEFAFAYDGLLPNDVYWKTLAEGKFPIGEISEAVGFSNYGLGPAFFHDLSHFSGMSRDPEYMKTLRETAQQVVNLSKKDLATATSRLNFISEQISSFPRSTESQIQKFLDTVKPVGKSELFNQEQFAAILRLKSNDEIKELWKKSEKDLPKMNSFGGLSSDSLVKQKSGAAEVMAPIDSAFNGGLDGETLASGQFNRSNLIAALSSRLTVADHWKGLSSAQLVKDLALNKKESAAIRLFCNNPSMFADIPFANGVCKK